MSALPGDVAHDVLDRQGVRKEVWAFYVIRKDRPCFFARGISGHIVPGKSLPPAYFSFCKDAMSMTKRYFTSLRSIRS